MKAFGFFATQFAVGALGFASVTILSRLVSPHDYGHYALIMAGASAVQAVCFSWMGIYVLRFCSGGRGEANVQQSLGAVIWGFLLVAALVCVVAAGGWAILSANDPPRWLLYIPFLGVLLAWFEISVQLSRASLDAASFAVKSFGKTLLTLVLGVAFVSMGWHQNGLVLGVFCSVSLIVAVSARRDFRGIKLSRSDIAALGALMSFGIPLAISFATEWMLTLSDRFLIYWLVSEAAAGTYALSYDLTRQPLLLMANACSLVILPMASRAFDRGEAAEVRQVTARGLSYLLMACLPIAVVEVICASEVTRIMMGVDYRELGSTIMPLLALAAMAICITSNYLCIPFHLARQTKVIVWISIGTGLLNVSANLVLIPTFGVIGAAYGIILAMSVSLGTYLYLSSRKGILGASLPDIVKIIVALSVFAAFMAWDVEMMFVVKAVLGGLLYAALILTLNPARLRTDMIEAVMKLRNRVGEREGSVMSETRGEA